MASMSKVNQLKNKARREEQRENWSRAIELYTQALDASRAGGEAFADLSLYNRIGDIYLRIGQKNTAVRYYEQAIERYAEQDLHTSAIALCNKVLRILPDRSTVFLQLGRLHLATNLVAEARGHYHRYAASMRERGTLASGLDALEELIGANGDPKTVSLWVSFLLQLPDRESAHARLEEAGPRLEKHGIDPAEIAGQIERGEAREPVSGTAAETEADPLAGAFLSGPEGEPATVPDSAPVDSAGASIGEPVADAGIPAPGDGERAGVAEDHPGRGVVSEPTEGADPYAALDAARPPTATPVEADDAEGHDGLAVGVDADDAQPEDLVADALTDVAAADDATATDEVDDESPTPGVLELGSRQWDDEVEEILAEFDRDLTTGFATHGLEAPDPDLRPSRDEPSPRPPTRERDEEQSRPDLAPVPTAGAESLDGIEVEPGRGAAAATHGDRFAPETETETTAGHGPIAAEGATEQPEARVVATRSLTLGRADLDAFEPDAEADRPASRGETADDEPAEAPASSEPVDERIRADADEGVDDERVPDLGGFEPEPALVQVALPEPETAESDAPLDPTATGPGVVDPEPSDGADALALSDTAAPADAVALPVSGETEPPRAEQDEAGDVDESWLSDALEAIETAGNQATEAPSATEDVAGPIEETSAGPIEETSPDPVADVVSRDVAESADDGDAGFDPIDAIEAETLTLEPPTGRGEPADDAETGVAAEIEPLEDELTDDLAAATEPIVEAEADMEVTSGADTDGFAAAESDEIFRVVPAGTLDEDSGDEIPEESEAEPSTGGIFELAPAGAESEPLDLGAGHGQADVYELSVHDADVDQLITGAAEHSAPDREAADDRALGSADAQRPGAEDPGGEGLAAEEFAREEPAADEPPSEERVAPGAPDTAEPDTDALDAEAAVDGPAAGTQPRQAPPAAIVDEMEGSFAETRLTIEDPEDAFVDWVKSASTGVLRRALPELEARSEAEKALLVIARLTELVDDIELAAKHVEYLHRVGRTDEAVEACIALARSLEAQDRLAEAQRAYAKALELAPGDERASAALADLGDAGPGGPEVEAARGGPMPYMPDHVHSTDSSTFLDAMPAHVAAVESPGAPGALQPYSGVAGGAEAGADFEQLLSEFRAELHEKPRKNGSGSRTELGASLKEMGRLDDAIRELQAAVREPSAPPLAFELLGEAFLEKGQGRIAARLLERALSNFTNGDREILGVLYQLGMAYESMSDLQRAVVCYERIFSVDIDYRDIQERILTCGS